MGSSANRIRFSKSREKKDDDDVTVPCTTSAKGQDDGDKIDEEGRRDATEATTVDITSLKGSSSRKRAAFARSPHEGGSNTSSQNSASVISSASSKRSAFKSIVVVGSGGGSSSPAEGMATATGRESQPPKGEGGQSAELSSAIMFNEEETRHLSEHLRGNLVVTSVKNRYNAAFEGFKAFMSGRNNFDLYMENVRDVRDAATLLSLFVLELYKSGLRGEQISARLIAVNFQWRVQVPSPKHLDVFQHKTVKDAIAASGRSPEEAAVEMKARKLRSKLPWNWLLMKRAIEMYDGNTPVPAEGFGSAREMDQRIWISTMGLMFDSSLRPGAVTSAEGTEEDHTFKREDIGVLLIGYNSDDDNNDGEAPKKRAEKKASSPGNERLLGSGQPLWRASHDPRGLRKQVNVGGVKFSPKSSKTSRRGGVSALVEPFWLRKGRSGREDELVDMVSSVLLNIPGNEKDDAFTRAFFEGADKVNMIREYLEQDPGTRPPRKGTKKLRKSDITTAAQAVPATLGLPQTRWSGRSFRAGTVQTRLLLGMRTDSEILARAKGRGSAWAEKSKCPEKVYSKNTEVEGLFALTKSEDDENLVTFEALKRTLLEVENGITDDLVAESDSEDERTESATTTAGQHGESSSKMAKKRKSRAPVATTATREGEEEEKQQKEKKTRKSKTKALETESEKKGGQETMTRSGRASKASSYLVDSAHGAR